MGCIRSATVREGDRDDPVRLAVIVTGSIIADRGNTVLNHYIIKIHFNITEYRYKVYYCSYFTLFYSMPNEMNRKGWLLRTLARLFSVSSRGSDKKAKHGCRPRTLM